jgi:DNA-binding response OmpR family regulator
VRFLIVDAQPSVGFAMAALVVQEGHEAAVATNGFSALISASERPPDVVLLDINMPGINGFETARRLRKRHADRFPIFAVTVDSVDVHLARQSGFDGVFSKPLGATKLATLISRLAG